MALHIIDTCINCGACEAVCPVQAISQGDELYVIDQDKCVKCKGHFDDPSAPRSARPIPVSSNRYDPPLPEPEAAADFFLKNKPYLVNLLLFAVRIISLSSSARNFTSLWYDLVLPQESGIFALILKNPAILVWGMPARSA